MPACSECGRSFDSDQGLRVHISIKHKELSEILKRQNKTSKQKKGHAPAQQPTRHSADQQNHDSDRPAGVTCSICLRHFDTQNGLRTHMASHPVASNRIRAARNLPTETEEPPDQPNEREADQSDEPLATQCERWQREFEHMSNNTEELDLDLFDLRVGEYLKFIFEATPKLPGPKHPAIKYYKKRRKRKLSAQSAGHSRSSNPQRTDKKAKKRRRDKYLHEVAQYNYYHLRKRVAREAMGDESHGPCPIPMTELKSHFE